MSDVRVHVHINISKFVKGKSKCVINVVARTSICKQYNTTLINTFMNNDDNFICRLNQ